MENGNESTGGRKREIMLRLCVTEAERDMIYEKMRQYNTNNFGAYARKMLIDGYVINIDTADIKAVAAEMQKIGVNINQIARRVNTTSRIYEQDFNELHGKVDEIWRLLRLSLLKPVVDGMKDAKDKTAYRREHESAFILHEAAARALRKHAGDGGKLPNPAALQSDYKRLTDSKNALRAEYGKLKQQAREYGITVNRLLLPIEYAQTPYNPLA